MKHKVLSPILIKSFYSNKTQDVNQKKHQAFYNCYGAFLLHVIKLPLK